MSTPKAPKGLVSLVGAGPGDPGLITVRGSEVLASADVVVIDRLAPADLLDLCRPDVEIVRAGKAPHGEGMSQDEINALLIDRAKQGLRVVRLKGGDPFVFGRGGEEAMACAKARVPWEIVPGVSSAIAVPAYAGIPVTQRGFTQDVAVVSGHVDPAARDAKVDWAALANGPGTLVLLMGVEKIGKIAAALVEHGRRGDTPVAMTRWGTTADQRTIVSDLDHIEHDAQAAKMTAPAVTVIGDVVKLRQKLNWWEARPLFGMRVVVPRTRQQAGALAAELRAYGATPVEIPTIAIEPPRNPALVDKAVSGVVSGRYAWIAFTSANAVSAITERLDAMGLDARVLAGVKLASVGDATTAALQAYGLKPDLVPSTEMSSEALAADWPTRDAEHDYLDRVLLPRADIATEALVKGLKAKGWFLDEVTTYRTVRAAPPPQELRDELREGQIDAIVLTSSSTARNLVALCGKPHERTLIAAIGPQTAIAAAEVGLRVDVQAKVSTVPGVAAALAAYVTQQRLGPPAKPVKPARAVKPVKPVKPARAVKSVAAKATAKTTRPAKPAAAKKRRAG